MSHNRPALPWYVIYTHPRRELFVTSLLSRDTDVTFFLPTGAPISKVSLCAG